MKDQTFSAKNFQIIFDTENRKGNDIEKRFPEIFNDSIEIRKTIKTLNQNIHRENDKTRKSELKERRNTLKKEREKSIIEVLEQISSKVNKSGFAVNVLEGAVYGKTSYSLEKSVENVFLSKQLQQNISQTYKIRQSSRYEIVSLLINLIEDEFPKVIIRTDIKSFYESIPQNKVIQKIKEDNLLSLKTQRFIGEILKGYNSATGQTKDYKGVPRGVGVSAYLSELYMRAIDNRIKELPDLVFYARYVDDIIAVFTPEKEEKGLPKRYKGQIKTIIDENNLSINDRKTIPINLIPGLKSIELNNSSCKSIEFLGYKIGSKKIEKEKKDGSGVETKYVLSVEMTENKLNRYKQKIKLAYDDFKNKKTRNRQRAFKLLLARMDYLSSNTKLRNNKSKVFVGIYYSSPFLQNAESLEQLNKSSQWRISRFGFTVEEKEKLSNCDFVKGFEEKKFKKLPLIKKTYKNHNANKSNSTNKGVLQFGLSEITKIWKNA
ncbi:antiviral reverse transcriptase Drt3a [Saccharicrinis fermentans]|uniref:antiviral reverse transcriptase Drt3a n=2 Tax=Saccharicrinis fermentans TaxID=982 RepID=UPI000487211A|nr:antiviral reverse transcriptase Drt3a [Saccharicrinis fermentans]